MSKTVISIDCMGGDYGPIVTVAGASLALKSDKDLEFLLFGDQALISQEVSKYPNLKDKVEIFHTDERVTADDKPAVALRKKRKSSMALAIQSVKEKRSQVVVSGGNTGALMAISTVLLRQLPGVDRPAICTSIPTERDTSVVLDLGANAECSAKNLVQFAIMGSLFAKYALGKENPTIGILNIGEEVAKGNDTVRLAYTKLKESKLADNFHGFVEGNDIPLGTVDVVVTDGFSGNIALKVLEGTAKFISKRFASTFKKSIRALLGGLLARSALMKMKSDLDPRNYNGGMLLGLNGVTVKSHGGTDEVGFKHAIMVSKRLVDANINEKISNDLQDFKS